jgi:YidC/Oxa1 family membrane protein insertase
MKLSAVAVVALLHQSSAFAPTAFTRSTNVRSNAFTHSAIDPSVLSDAHAHIDTLSNFFSSITISDADVAEVAEAATDAVAKSADNGWFGFLEGPIEFLLQSIHGALGTVGLSENSWGVTIIAMTTIIKLLTYPLTAQQLQSTSKMQALQPTIKDIQAKYASNPEVMNQKIAAIYQDNEVNPLAGCIPSILQIPIFIGLYRAVLTLANGDKLNEPFLWLPNLEGPTYGADPASASGWLFSGWVDGVPALGWADTLAFLTIPVVLVISQSISMNLMATKDQEQPAFIKFLPLLIGWFSLNVPAALGIYWVANNFITTALTLQIRSGIKPVVPVTDGGGGSSNAANVIDLESTFTPAPLREKPAGFGASDDGGDGIKPITPVDAEIVEAVTVEASAPTAETNTPKKKKNRGKKKKKKRN